jgi:hypothetical protein
MCDERVLDFQKIMQSLSTRVPKIIVQKAEEIFPSLKEGLVSILCLCVKKQILLPCSQWIYMARATK